MKIIASTGRRNWRECFLVEMTEDELITIGQGGKAEIGAEIKVSEAWNDLQRFRAAKETGDRRAQGVGAHPAGPSPTEGKSMSSLPDKFTVKITEEDRLLADRFSNNCACLIATAVRRSTPARSRFTNRPS